MKLILILSISAIAWTFLPGCAGERRTVTTTSTTEEAVQPVTPVTAATTETHTVRTY